MCVCVCFIVIYTIRLVNISSFNLNSIWDIFYRYLFFKPWAIRCHPGIMSFPRLLGVLNDLGNPDTLKWFWLNKFVTWLLRLYRQLCLFFIHRSPRGGMFKTMDCGVSEFELQLIRLLSDKYLWERHEPPYPPSYGLDSTTTAQVIQRVQTDAMHYDNLVRYIFF